MAALSDGLIIAMIVAYAIALFLFALEAAYGRRKALAPGRMDPVGATAGSESGAKGAGGREYASASPAVGGYSTVRSEEHTSELQSRENLVCRLLLEKKNYNID